MKNSQTTFPSDKDQSSLKKERSQKEESDYSDKLAIETLRKYNERQKEKKQQMTAIYKSKIVGFEGTSSSIVAYLILEDEDGKIHRIPCENGVTVNALQDAYGNIIAHKYLVDLKKLIEGERWIYWYLDDMGIALGGFVPIMPQNEGKLDELEKLYRKTKEKNAGV